MLEQRGRIFLSFEIKVARSGLVYCFSQSISQGNTIIQGGRLIPEVNEAVPIVQNLTYCAGHLLHHILQNVGA